jgi:hypothetical protein
VEGSSLQAIVFVGSTPIGGPLLGLICDRYGARAGLVIGGVAALGAAGWGLFADRRPSRPREEADGEAAGLEADQRGGTPGLASPMGGGEGVDDRAAVLAGGGQDGREGAGAVDHALPAPEGDRYAGLS